MAILSASTALTRYRIVEDVSDDLLRRVPELFKQHAFQDIDHTADERSFGWVNIDDFLDCDWSSAPPEKGEYFAFSLRLDTRRVQAAVYKKHVAMAVAKEMAENEKEKGKKFLSRERTREIREQVMLKLRARSLPIPAVFDAAWAMRQGRVYLASTNAKVRALFEDCFSMTFDLHLEQLTPFFLAIDMLGEKAVSRLETLEPTIFSEG